MKLNNDWRQQKGNLFCVRTWLKKIGKNWCLQRCTKKVIAEEKFRYPSRKVTVRPLCHQKSYHTKCLETAKLLFKCQIKIAVQQVRLGIWHLALIRPSDAPFWSSQFNMRIPASVTQKGQVQTPYFTWAESNANEKNPLFSLISIRFGSCEVQRLNQALEKWNKVRCMYFK